MARKAMIEKEKRRKKLVDKYWDKREQLKKIIIDQNTEYEDKMIAVDKLNSLPKNSSKVRLRNRCQMTGRPKGYLRKFKLSRHCFREMASSGIIPGVIKASW